MGAVPGAYAVGVEYEGGLLADPNAGLNPVDGFEDAGGRAGSEGCDEDPPAGWLEAVTPGGGG